jgi:regulator of protease activity HflC (stomatin/prohibitin superfamily)
MVRLEVTWEVTDAEVFATRLASPEATIRDLVSEAAIEAAAGRTAESIRRDVSPEGSPGALDRAMLARSSFSRQIQQGAQRSLDDLGSGIRIVQVSIPNYSWHPRALGAYEEAQRRFQDMDARINRARRDAAEKLRQAAGTAYVELVGEPGSPNQRPRDYPEDREYNLIGQYNLARDADDTDQAEQILARINRVLQGAGLGGEARMLIAEAESYRTGVEQAAKQRANRFLSLLETYQNPQFRQMLLSRLWDATRQRIFANPLVERNFLPPNQQTVRLLVPRDATAGKEARRIQTQENSDREGS